MAFKTIWLLEDKVIHHKIWGNFTREEVHEADVLLNEMFDQSSASTIHMLVNDAEIAEMPPITSLRTLSIASHPKMGWSIIYGNKNKGLRFTTNIATKILGLRFMMASSYEDAINKLYSSDSNLPPIDLNPPE